jgi:hypothetical protein
MIRIIFLFLFISTGLFAQTGIGTTTPNVSAKLEVYSTNKGFLPPRVTLTSTTDASTITSPAEGLLVYNLGSVGLQAGYYYWNGANWATIATATSAGNGVTSMDLVKLYSKGYSTASGDIAHANGFSFTVPVSGRYLFDFSCTGFSNATITYKVRQGTTDIGTDAQYSTNNTVHVEYNGKIEVNLQSGISYNVYVNSTGNRDAGDYDRVYYKMVAGNLPVNGQSVDYVSVLRTTSQTVNTGDNIIFNTVKSGNIPYNTSTGTFTLAAGKTYRLTGSVSLDGSNAGSAEIDVIWKNAAGDELGNRALILSTNYATAAAGNGVTDVVYTPSINTTASLYVIYATLSAKTVPNTSFANIEQIGSSAIVNPWTLAGTNTYNTTGNVGIGTNAPTQALDVIGNVKTSGNYMYSDGSTTAKKVAGYYNSEIYLSLDNIKVACTRNGAGGSMAGLSIGAVSTSFVADLSATYSNAGSGGSTATGVSYTTTASNSAFGWGFGQGNQSTYLLNDTTNSRVYRITLMIGANYNNNFISIERLL